MPYADKEQQKRYFAEYDRKRRGTAKRRKQSRDKTARWRQRHRERHLESARRQNLKNHTNGRSRHWWLMRTYGISHDDYERMLEKQGGKCALCGGTQRFRHQRNMHVDHDHTGGEIRGILCGRCNSALGIIREDTDWLRQAAEYLNGCKGPS